MAQKGSGTHEYRHKLIPNARKAYSIRPQSSGRSSGDAQSYNPRAIRPEFPVVPPHYPFIDCKSPLAVPLKRVPILLPDMSEHLVDAPGLGGVQDILEQRRSDAQTPEWREHTYRHEVYLPPTPCCIIRWGFWSIPACAYPADDASTVPERDARERRVGRVGQDVTVEVFAVVDGENAVDAF